MGTKPLEHWRHAKLTGIETEGELKGTVVCPIIYLWKLNRSNLRIDPRYKLPHDTEVLIDRTATNTQGENLVHVRKVDHKAIHGWVTERFINYDLNAE